MVQDQSWGTGEYHGSGLQLYPWGCTGDGSRWMVMDRKLGFYYLDWEA